MTSSNDRTGKIISLLSAYFAADVDYSTVLLLSTLSSLLMIPGSLFAGAVMGKKLSFRATALLSMGGIVIAVVAPYFVRDINFALVMRAIVGFCIGMGFPLQSTLALKLFNDEERPRMLGWATFVMALGSIVYMQASGRAAVINAAYSYLVHGIVIIPLILIMIFLKEPETEKASSSGLSETKSSEKLPGAVIFSSLMFAIIFFAFYPVLLNISAIVDHDKLGDAVMAGTISSLFTIGNAIAGLIFARVHKIAGRYTIATGLIAWVAGTAIFSFGESITMLGIGMFLCGVAVQIVWPGTINSFSEYVPQSKLAFASAIFSSGMNIGCFLTTFFISAVANLSGNNDPRLPCVYGLVIVIICAIVWSIGEAGRKKS